jgi:hypothetical protein
VWRHAFEISVTLQVIVPALLCTAVFGGSLMSMARDRFGNGGFFSAAAWVLSAKSS